MGVVKSVAEAIFHVLWLIHCWISDYMTLCSLRSKTLSQIFPHALLKQLRSKFVSAGKRQKQHQSLFRKPIRCVTADCRKPATTLTSAERRLHLITNGITATMDFSWENIFFFIVVISK